MHTYDGAPAHARPRNIVRRATTYKVERVSCLNPSSEMIEWQILKPAVLGAIMEHFTRGLPVINNEAELDGEEDGPDFSDPVVQQIQELLDTRVRPAVAGDGGDIVFRGFEEGIVYLSMQGACAGCPSSTATLKMGIENMLRHFIPEVQEVRPAPY